MIHEAPNNRWSSIIESTWKNSRALSLAVAGLDGCAVFMNEGMRVLIGMEKAQSSDGEAVYISDYMINPTFSRILESEDSRAEEPCFEGEATFGRLDSSTWSIRCRIYKTKDQILIAGESDLEQLRSYNDQLNFMNQEVQNLQREILQEKKNLERTLKELRETQQMLIHAEKMNALGHLVAGVAHEINNPLSYVSGNLHSLKSYWKDLLAAMEEMKSWIQNASHLADEAPGSRSLDLFEKINQAYDIDFIINDFNSLHSSLLDGTGRIGKIVNDLKAFSRLDEGERKTVDLLESIESTLSLMKSDFRKKNIELELFLEPIPPLECYPGQLNQVFMNLMINAVQAMSDSGKLTIRTGFTGTDAEIRIQDTGPGISADIQEKIMNPFFTTKEPGQGTGLGLSIADRIVSDRHGGALLLEYTSEEGSGFLVRLPYKKQKEVK